MSRNNRSRIRRGIESLYGAILTTMLIISFISLYTMYKEDQRRSYEAIINSLNIEYERSLENIFISGVNYSSKQIYISSSIDTEIVSILASRNDTTLYIDLRNTSLKIPGGLPIALPIDLSEKIFNYAKQGYKIYLITKRGNLISLNIDPYMNNLGSSLTNNTIYSMFDYVFYAEKDVYYIVYGSWDVYIYNQSLGLPQIYPYVYIWDINTSYTIFRAPESTYIFLKRSYQNRGIMETKSWFKSPTILYAQDPTDLRIILDVYLDPPYLGKWTRITWGSGTTSINYIYNGSVVIVINASWTYPGGLIAYWKYENYVEPKTYNLTVIVRNFGLELYIEATHTLVTKDAVNKFLSNLAWTGVTGDYYYPYIFSSVVFPGGSKYVGGDLYRYLNFTFSILKGSYGQTPEPQANEVDLYISVVGYVSKTYYLNIINTTKYSPVNGYIIASNGNKIFDLSPLIYYGWSYN
ncbi:MAG: hypothetical protein ACP5GI_00015 [Sulfolobales archaeon]